MSGKTRTRTAGEKRQERASAPDTSAWVSASAGTGKTHVLVNRVIRLLLENVAPEKILCLTFTRAAAAEMAERLFEELSQWIACSDDELIERIHHQTGHVQFKRHRLNEARRLFTRALETPGGLKIQTIHAFCERLLQRFPLEAGLAPGFVVMDDREAAAMRRKALDAVLAAAASEPQGAAGRDLAVIVEHTGFTAFEGLLEELVTRRDILEPLRQWHAGELASAYDDFLQLPAGDSRQGVLDEVLGGLDRPACQHARDVLAGRPGASDRRQAERLAGLLDARCGEIALAIMSEMFLKKDNQPRSPNSLLSKAAREQHPQVAAFLDGEQDRVMGLVERLGGVAVRDASSALTRLAIEVLGRIDEEKRRQGRYDYDDLIERTLALLSSPSAMWVLYKLDGGLDHVLIDEAQDTSPRQWEIVRIICEEFFSGDGARGDVVRTVFAVGDRKQSIFSFQGADPDAFDRMQAHFHDKVCGAGQAFPVVPFTRSYRSAPIILEAVDTVFANPKAGKGVAGAGERIVHEAYHQGRRGLVELWPLVEDEDDADGDAEGGESDGGEPLPARIRLAERIAETVRRWIDEGEPLYPGGRAITAGDVLILLRTRMSLMQPLVRALKGCNVPVAGVDRLVLQEHIAVQDILSMARHCLCPDDDLTLAEVLKSPLIVRDDGRAFGDDDLFDLAYMRAATTLVERLAAAAAAGKPYEQANAALRRWREWARRLPPFEFFSRVLVGDDRLAMIHRRLGHDALDPIEALMARAREFEAEGTGWLGAFVASFEGGEEEIKRDLDHHGSAVRIMTVHGAKGLQAPIVILPDTCSLPDSGRSSQLIVASRGRQGGAVVMWPKPSPVKLAAIEQLKEERKEHDREEYNRLFYVAMTRASHRLYVAGVKGKRDLDEQCWYRLFETALKDRMDAVSDEAGDVVAWRMSDDRPASDPDFERRDAEAGRAASAPGEAPDWVRQAAPVEPPPARRLAPSRVGADDGGGDSVTGESGGGQAAMAMQLGQAAHALLQALPETAPVERLAKAKAYLRTAVPGCEQAQTDALAERLVDIVGDDKLADLFAAGSLAEVAIAGDIEMADGETVHVNGRIDRLVVGDDAVRIVDFKSGTGPLDGCVPVQYVRQMAAYRALAAKAFDKPCVDCFILWIGSGTLVKVDEREMTAVLPPPSTPPS